MLFIFWIHADCSISNLHTVLTNRMLNDWMNGWGERENAIVCRTLYKRPTTEIPTNAFGFDEMIRHLFIYLFIPKTLINRVSFIARDDHENCIFNATPSDMMIVSTARSYCSTIFHTDIAYIVLNCIGPRVCDNRTLYNFHILYCCYRYLSIYLSPSCPSSFFFSCVFFFFVQLTLNVNTRISIYKSRKNIIIQCVCMLRIDVVLCEWMSECALRGHIIWSKNLYSHGLFMLSHW